ncbi:MAG: glycerol-3-phosphate 1-O-acyltransferase PlsY [Bacteroidales bacterium]|nr:glycerol-3-phosphate 1-O-acyltransferase PlsY [Bacteroidales bacterium]MCF8405098.1 glycerol-3-phosphate 1-O-acyltransferase PlsY [Bacteroidales bacterium]
MTIFIAIVLAYLIGSIPTAVWIGRIFYNVDVRTIGSGNAGATNTIRVLGLKAGIPVLLIDVFKGWIAVYVAHFFELPAETFPDLVDFKIMLAAAAVIGHIFPIYVGFKGGKGVATLLGVGLAIYPEAAGIAVLIFITVLLLTKYVSLGSIIAAITFPFFEIFILGHNQYISLMVLAIAVAIFIPLTHRKNIKRLLKGEESKFKTKKN